jgi:hypothetical protein
LSVGAAAIVGDHLDAAGTAAASATDLADVKVGEITSTEGRQRSIPAEACLWSDILAANIRTGCDVGQINSVLYERF